MNILGKKLALAGTACISALSLSACAENYAAEGAGAGAAAGAAIGALTGGNVVEGAAIGAAATALGFTGLAPCLGLTGADDWSAP